MKLTIDQDRFFRKLTLRVAGCLEIETAARRCLDLFSTIMPVDLMGFHQYSRDTGTLHTPALASPQGIRLKDHTYRLPPSMRPKVRQRWSTRVWAIDRLGDDPVTAEAASALGLSDTSAMLMDLTLGGRYTGVVSMANCQGYPYTPADTGLLTALNEPLALAFTNGMQFRELSATREHLEQDNRILRGELSRATTKPVIGARQGLKQVMDQAVQVAPTQSPVLLLGQTGTGKEVIARAIHDASPRRNHPFVPVNCGALPLHLADSELFGHEKGAFTGAHKQHRGYFERAHNGTLFLDEIGELPRDVQVRLLRVLQEKEIGRVGGSRPLGIDTRIIAATNRDLEALVRKGRFREDLYFRIRVFPIHIPPLRERTSDIGALARHFIEAKSLAMNKFPIPEIPDTAVERLRQYPWPGNVRELENMVERALIRHSTGPLAMNPFENASALQAPVTPPEKQAPLEIQPLDQVIISHIRRVLDITNGRVEGPGGAAERLNVNPSTLRVRMKKYGIAYGRNYAPRDRL